MEVTPEQMTQTLSFITNADKLGIVAMSLVFLITSLIGNLFLFKHAMANCGGIKEVLETLDKLNITINKTNEIQLASINLTKEFQNRESVVLKETLERETNSLKTYTANQVDYLKDEVLNKLFNMELNINSILSELNSVKTTTKVIEPKKVDKLICSNEQHYNV